MLPLWPATLPSYIESFSSACADPSLEDLPSSHFLQRSVGAFRLWPAENYRAAVFMIEKGGTWLYLLRKRWKNAHVCFAC